MATPLKLPFGKYQGEYITRVSVDYLQWMVRRESMVRDGVDYKQAAVDELVRRGGKYDGIIPSHHAIDRFSTRYTQKWVEASINNTGTEMTQGVAAYLSTLGVKAWAEGVEYERRPEFHQLIIKKTWDGIKFVFLCNAEGEPHTIKTVM